MKQKRQYRWVRNTKSFVFLLLFFLLLQLTQTQSFCHITCTAISCSNALNTGCTTCAPYFIGGSPSTCNWDTALTTIKLSKVTADFTFSSGTAQTCGGYAYRGNYGNLTALILSTTTPIPETHFQVELILWLIKIDQWSSGSSAKVQMIGSPQSYTVDQFTSNRIIPLCQNNGAPEGYQRLSAIFTHSDITAVARFNITTLFYHNNAKLGIRDAYLLVYSCHAYCLTCTGTANTQCMSCVSTFWLSGTTCDTACLPGYGTNLPSNVCVLCHSYCLTCATVDTNCTICKDTIIVGTNTTASQIYKVEDQNRCQVICPTGYYSHLTSKMCLNCAVRCPNITITSQLLNSGESLEFTYTFTEPMDWTGFNYQDFLNFNCTNTSISVNSDFTYVYTPVDTLSFKVSLTPKPTKYLVASTVCTIVKPEGGNPLKFSSDLNKLSPSVYTSFNCLTWSTPQVTMTISNVVTQATESIEYTFTFSHPMDFTGFDFADFTNRNKNITAWSTWNDFTHDYTPISSTQFKITTKPKKWTYFSNISFCVTIEPESSNDYQFSAQFYKLAPSVYTQSSCGIFYACHPFCLVCDMLPQNCSTCDDTIIVGSNSTASQIYKVEGLNQCQVICPSGYYAFLATKECLSCALHCPNISITSQLLNGGESLEFTYTFTEPMDWTGFNYQNFVNFNCSNTSIATSSDFTYVYTPVDALSFKVSLTPKPTKYLVAASVCTLVKPEAGNPLKFSAGLNKLAPSVYTSFNCLTWSTPQVTMTISNVVTQATESIEWTFTFSHPMDFTGFDFGNFTNRNKNITAWSIWGDFNNIYTPVDTTNFKITLTPKTWTYFSNATFCTTVESESDNELQFSAQWYKLAPTVYTQSSCGVLYACHPFCLVCDMLPQNCSTCDDTIIVGTNTTASQIYKVQGLNQCEVNCPTGYYSHLATKACLSCALHCINLTITSAFINAGESLQFTYTFDEIMDFAGFDWQSFLYFNCTKTSINAATDFTFLYTLVNDMTFKIQLTPKPTKYLVNDNLCTVIKPANVNLFKYSLALNKIGPSVYTSFLCPLWSTPQVDLAMSNIVSLPTESIEYTFTFSGPMDFSTFVFTDFVFFRSDDAFLNMGSDFTYTYTMVDSLTFKVVMATTPLAFFGNTSLCAVSKSQTSTSFQFSALWYKLSPVVYDQETCGILYACHPFCTSCMFSPTNCQTCGDTIIVGSNTTASQIYKVENVDACEVICPSGYFDHLPSKMCLSCALNCANMTINSQFLPNGKTLNGSSIQFTYTFTQAFDFSTFDWTTFLSFTSTNSSINPLTDFTIVYTVVNPETFAITLSPNPTKYLRNDNFCTVITPYPGNPYIFSLGLKRLDFGIYTMINCVPWTTPQVNMTISHFINPIEKYLEFTFAFTSEMDWTGFVYQDFLDLTQIDPTLVFSRDITVVYSVIDGWSFKLRLTGNLGVFFVNNLFCAISHLQTLTALQFSLEWYKLHPSVYGQQSCVMWTLPPANLTIFGQVLANGSYSAYSEFTFTFTSPINFTDFDYTGFLDFTQDNPKLTLEKNFTVKYFQKDPYSFVLTLNYRPKTEFDDITTCFKVKPKPDANLHFASDWTPLGPTVYQQSYCTFWSVPEPLTFYYYKDLEKFNNQMEVFFTEKGTQQLVKSGVLSFLMPGAQWTSLVLLHQPRQIQQLYEGTRFWGTFVFFDVPPYEKDSNKTKYTFLDPNNEILQKPQQRRMLQTGVSYVDQWRFNRTGHSGFFLFDTYIQLILIGVAWILFICAKGYEWRNNSNEQSVRVVARVMVLFHKIHEMVLFYLLLSSLVEYKNLDINTYMHRISMIVSFVVLAYYLLYQLKIFYDMVGYPKTKIHTESYVWYLKYYGYFIAYYRFEEYSDRNTWIWRHFLRPYNYHTLTFVKRVLMLAAAPIFYDYLFYPVFIITFLQGMDIVRFLLTYPYHKIWRNILYFTLETLLFVFFVSSLINQYSGKRLFDDDDVVIDVSYENIYYFSGWVGIAACFIYNSLYSMSCFGEFFILLTYKDSLENMMWQNRHSYYLDLYSHFEKFGSLYRLIKNYTDELNFNRERKELKTYKNWVNRLHDSEPITDLSRDKLKVFKEIVQRGDIMKFDLDEKEDQKLKHIIEVKIESILLKDFKNIEIEEDPTDKQTLNALDEDQTSKINARHHRKTPNTRWYRKKPQKVKEQPLPLFKIDLEVIPAMFKSDFKLKNRKKGVYIPKKVKNLVFSQKMDQDFLKYITDTLIKFYDHGTGITQIKVSTILTVDLAKYQDQQEIYFDPECIRQELVIMHGREKQKIRLRKVMAGFPIDLDELRKSSYWKLVENDEEDNVTKSAYLNSFNKGVNSGEYATSSDSESERFGKVKDSNGFEKTTHSDTQNGKNQDNRFGKNPQEDTLGKLSQENGYEKVKDEEDSDTSRNLKGDNSNIMKIPEKVIQEQEFDQNKYSQGYVNSSVKQGRSKEPFLRGLRKPRTWTTIGKVKEEQKSGTKPNKKGVLI